ncbi:hypothetical protein [Halomontanus rarus]|uniref:hypothetical protein n=1 Tax=Halomontanus rarus TaxID=3034020 RepID=UPI0023E8DA98|nr:hypothetical protein [Halovivax sp. TS33]
MIFRNNRSIIIGGLVTAISTGLLFVFPIFIPFDELKTFVFEQTNVWWSGNPSAQLPYLGGIPGGLITGYLAKDYWGNDEWGTAMKYGVYAALSGLGLIYVVFVVYNVVQSMLVSGMFSPPLYLISVIPLIYGIPLIFIFVIEAFFAAIIGNGCSRLTHHSEKRPVKRQ